MPLPAAAGTIRLRDDADNLVRRRGQQRVERGHGEGRRAEEHDPQAIYHLPARVSLWIFFTIMSRLMPRGRSTNKLPSR